MNVEAIEIKINTVTNNLRINNQNVIIKIYLDALMNIEKGRNISPINYSKKAALCGIFLKKIALLLSAYETRRPEEKMFYSKKTPKGVEDFQEFYKALFSFVSTTKESVSSPGFFWGTRTTERVVKKFGSVLVDGPSSNKYAIDFTKNYVNIPLKEEIISNLINIISQNHKRNSVLRDFQTKCLYHDIEDNLIAFHRFSKYCGYTTGGSSYVLDFSAIANSCPHMAKFYPQGEFN